MRLPLIFASLFFSGFLMIRLVRSADHAAMPVHVQLESSSIGWKIRGFWTYIDIEEGMLFFLSHFVLFPMHFQRAVHLLRIISTVSEEIAYDPLDHSRET